MSPSPHDHRPDGPPWASPPALAPALAPAPAPAPDPALPRVVLRRPEDALALIPFSLGFHPQHSLVLLTTTDDERPFHARVDLPPAELPDRLEILETLADQLTDAALANGGGVGVVVAYTDDAVLGEIAAQVLGATLESAGLAVAMEIRADGRRWFPVDDDDHLGVPYDVRDHPLTAQAVVAGRVTYASRTDLVDSLVPRDPDDLEAVAVEAARLLRRRGAGDPGAGLGLDEEARWLRDQASCRPPGDRLTPAEVARVLVAVRDVETRDRVWAALTRADAPQWVALLGQVVGRTPVELVAAPAGLLAFAAWLAGDGALAWCAVDRAREADPRHRLAGLVAQALERAVPPSAWRPPET